VSGALEGYAARPLGEAPDACVDRPARFQKELEQVGGKVATASSLAGVHELLRNELAFWKAQRIVSWAVDEFVGWDIDNLFLESACASFRPSTERALDLQFRTAALEADVGITTVDYAVVNTGTLVVSARPGRPRSVSLLPTIHLALVRETQLVDRLGLAFSGFRARGPALPSAIHFITGPSRTSDIENDLSIGVHGPAVVSVILWRDRPAGKAAS
jgi:L-lactate dehydrogenase complex protein LldG